MISISMIYHGKEDFKCCLAGKGFDTQDVCLVRIYTANCAHDEAVELARDVKAVLPNARILGGSGSGVIFNGKQFDDDTLVIVERFAHAEVYIHEVNFENMPPSAVAAQIAGALQSDAQLIHVLCGDHYEDAHEFTNEFNALNTNVKMVGGVVGDVLSKDLLGYVFTEEGAKRKGIVVAEIAGEGLHSFCDVNIAHAPISTVYTLDECSDGRLICIDGKPGTDWCREQFGLEEFHEYTGWQLIAENDELLRFPMIIEGHNGASRFVRYDQETGSMSTYFTRIADGTPFRIGYTSPTACVQECFNICNNIMKTPVESLFCYTCLFRKLYMGNCAEWELRPFSHTHICGVFMMGEFGYINGTNEFFNGACSFVGTADRMRYIKPDFNVFEDMFKIKDDNKKLNSFVLQKQSTTMSLENKKLLEKLILQQEEAKKQLYIDPNTGMKNSIQFSHDNQTYHFDKMCMVQVENSALLIAKLGQQGYYTILTKVLQEVAQYVQNSSYRDVILSYGLNDNTVFMAANDAVSEAVFRDIVDELYNKYQFVKLADRNEMFVNRFVVILNQQDLLTSGLVTLQNCENLQTHFLISDCTSGDDNPRLNEEMEMLHVLNYVIEQRKVVPYFQGIYDNRLGTINKYEALMRIEDEDGQIYTPYAFMDIAKKYHMYSSLSKIMIGKVFDLFAGERDTVSINLSSLDINFDEMQTFIFDCLERTGDASNFIFEILEDENFRDMERLKAFIDKARMYGVEIAIDDFGSGYSNFMEIVKIEPDYIKIDISIIKYIHCNDTNRKVLETICFLGRQLNSKLVAEGVETAEIQQSVEGLNIQFSQGYYFSRPMPYRDDCEPDLKIS